MADTATIPDQKLTELTAEVVSAYVARNSLPASELPALLQSVHSAFGKLTGTIGASEETTSEPPKPAVPIKKSITDDYLISLENGQKFKSLKRHLMTAYNMTPEQYRAKWGLPKDYPMVAPAYAASRSNLAKTLGLGRKPMPKPIEAPRPAPPVAAPVAEKKTRKRKEAVPA